MTLRSSLARVLVDQHEISQELAEWHVARMTDAEVEADLALYERQGVGVGFGSRAPEFRPAADRAARDGDTAKFTSPMR